MPTRNLNGRFRINSALEDKSLSDSVHSAVAEGAALESESTEPSLSEMIPSPLVLGELITEEIGLVSIVFC